MENQLTTLATINRVAILIVQNGEKPIPVKPICEALGIDTQTQIDKIKEDEVLSSVARLSLATGADGKQYEMFCIPLKYTFGWLFTINPKNVKPDAKEAVIKYRKACYDALFNHFSERATFIEDKAIEVENKLIEFRTYQEQFKDARTNMEASKNALDEVRKMDFDSWKAKKNQFDIPFLED